MGSPGMGVGKRGTPLGARVVGLHRGWGVMGEKKPQWGDLGGDAAKGKPFGE